MLAHAAVGCVSGAAGGGECGPAALSAGVAKFATQRLDGMQGWDNLQKGIAVSVIGGTASVLGGGKFENGAVTAAFGYLFNQRAGAAARGGAARGGARLTLSQSSSGAGSNERDNPLTVSQASTGSSDGEAMYGPYHRLESPTQTAWTTLTQVVTQEVWGGTPRGGFTPTVQAYRGPLPDAAKGIEFFTTVAPAPGNHPVEVRWYGSDPGVRTAPVGDFATIPVRTTRFKVF